MPSFPTCASAATAVVAARVGLRSIHAVTGVTGHGCKAASHGAHTSMGFTVAPSSCAGLALPSFMRSGALLAASTTRAHDCGGCGYAVTTVEQHRLCSSPGRHPYMPGQAVPETYPIIQLPARSLWCRQYPLDARRVAQGEYAGLISKVKEARHHYQYPSMSAPQTGWNVQMFTLFDNSVFINPVNLGEEEWRAEAARLGMPWITFEENKMCELRAKGQTGFAWEPCASSGFMLHYIERPLTVRVRALDEHGQEFTVTLDKMRGRMALHELDHLQGVLFTRRVVDTNHVIPMEGFLMMSDWSDDYPSLEARSTFLYTTFTPPYHFASDSVPDGNLLDRRFEDGIYPGCEQDRQQRIDLTAMEEYRRNAWRKEKAKWRNDGEQRSCGDVAADDGDAGGAGGADSSAESARALSLESQG